MGDTHLEDIAKKLVITNKKQLAWIRNGMNLLIINPRVGEHFILTNDVMKSSDFKLGGHWVLGIKLIIALDELLDFSKKILMLGEGRYVQILNVGKDLIGSM